MGIFGRSNDKANGRIDTLVAEAARIIGDVEFAGGLHLDGRVTGNVRADIGSAATLWVSEKGQVEGNIDVPIVVLNGEVRGDVLARDKLVLGAKARISGNVSYGVMEMAPGAQVSGKLAPISATGATSSAQSGPVALKALPGGFDGRKSAS
jgi:cytoskeletal protein CcmA (bactofilin family)